MKMLDNNVARQTTILEQVLDAQDMAVTRRCEREHHNSSTGVASA